MIEACQPAATIDEASTTDEAERLWRERGHTVVFLDLVLLGDSRAGERSLASAPAVELAKKLAKQEPAPRIVLASALHTDHPHMRETRPFAAAVVGKPFRAEDVARALRSLG